MNCYYHQTEVAVGLCKSCQKGLCPRCAVELKKSLACVGRCEEDVESLNQMVERTIRISPITSDLVVNTSRSTVLSGLFMAGVGLVFGVWGLLKEDGPIWFGVFLGLAFVTYGAFTVVKGLRMPRASS